jgi:hypothetical protein
MIIDPSFFDCEPHWPPQPHPLTGLRLSKQSEWGVNEWKLYAQILEDAGYYLLEALVITDEELSESEAKKSRSKQQPVQATTLEVPPGKTLLTSARYYSWEPPEPKAKRGPNYSKGRKELINAVIEKYNEMKTDPLCKKATVSGALEKVLAGTGIRWQDKRSILNDPRLKGLKKKS